MNVYLAVPAAALRLPGWEIRFDSHEGVLVALHPDRSTGIRVVGSSVDELVVRASAIVDDRAPRS